ncbi:hypothetical protein G9A89_021424 [Geosiphon pyriformis]|nr:hypothetical protein G9A89_021424 [Geosiphon pyriformis]
MKKTVKAFGPVVGLKLILLRKKKRGGILKNASGDINIVSKVQDSHLWGSKTGNTTESNSMNMKKKCLVEETSFDYGADGTLADGNLDQTPKGSWVKTKKTLGKPLGKINFLSDNKSDDILLDASLALPSSLKNLVNVFVRKFFVLDIDLNNVAEKSVQEKLGVVRKLFSKINGFGGVFTPSKFAGIIRATFTSESNWAVVLKKIPIGTLAETVCTVLSDFELIKLIKIQLIGLWQKAVVEFKQIDHADLVAAKWSILIGKDARLMHIIFGTTLLQWVIKLVLSTIIKFFMPRPTICFDSADFLDAVMGTTSVLRGANLHWSCFVLVRCAGCRKLGHTSLACFADEKKSVSSVAYLVSFGSASWTQIANGTSFFSLPVQSVLLNSGSSLEMKPTLLVFLDLNNSPRCQPLVTPSSQNQGTDIVINEGSSMATSDKTVAGAVVFDPSVISKMEETLRNLLVMVMNLSAKIDNANSVPVFRSSQ